MVFPSSANFSPNLMLKSVKSTRPKAKPKGGMMMSFTNEVTILPKAPPTITPTAMSITLPRMANSLNSFKNLLIVNYILNHITLKNLIFLS